jgi:hypothetical protein
MLEERLLDCFAVECGGAFHTPLLLVREEFDEDEGHEDAGEDDVGALHGVRADARGEEQEICRCCDEPEEDLSGVSCA